MPQATRPANLQLKSKPKPKSKWTAATADRHALYEASVQDTEQDIAFIDRIYKKEHAEKPLVLREDFCGTAKLCADWVSSAPERTAKGLDLHQPTMNWGLRQHIKPLGDKKSRVALLKRDVREGCGQSNAIDVTVAFNFSYCALKTRADMLRYMRCVFKELKGGGAFFLDIHGGSECYEEMEESTKHKGFTYVWDQGPYDAVGGLAKRFIHFQFPDGTEMRRAFRYDWRLWQLTELSDIAQEVGFARMDVYWEGADAKGQGNGIFRKVQRADNELSWIAYLVAWKPKS